MSCFYSSYFLSFNYLNQEHYLANLKVPLNEVNEALGELLIKQITSEVEENIGKKANLFRWFYSHHSL